MPEMPYYIVDVFAEAPYTGNQLAVIRGNPDANLMLQLAQEMNFSETTFITSDTARNSGYDVRIFTPVSELPFAGHPTLGTAYVIRHELTTDAPDQIILNLKVGPISVSFVDDVVWMQQNSPQFGHIYPHEVIAQMLGLSPDDMDTRFPVQAVSTGLPFIIAPIKTLDAVKRAHVNLPVFVDLIQAGKDDGLAANAIFIFTPETYYNENDINARSFAHLHGSPEDPATGSANGDLTGYLVKYRYFGTPNINVRVEQGYEIKRPSLLLLQGDDRNGEISVRVGGRVRMVAHGTLV